MMTTPDDIIKSYHYIIVIEQYKRNVITKEMKGYLIPKGSQPEKVQANPKIHKNKPPVKNNCKWKQSCDRKYGRSCRT
jgi:hypothetical protein